MDKMPVFYFVILLITTGVVTKAQVDGDYYPVRIAFLVETGIDGGTEDTAKKMLNELSNTEVYTHVTATIIKFNDTSNVLVNLSTAKDALDKWDVRPSSSARLRYTHLALDDARKQLFPNKIDPDDVTIVLLITHGEPSNLELTTIAARKLQRRGSVIFVVHCGDRTAAELRAKKNLVQVVGDSSLFYWKYQLVNGTVEEILWIVDHAKRKEWVPVNPSCGRSTKDSTGSLPSTAPSPPVRNAGRIAVPPKWWYFAVATVVTWIAVILAGYVVIGYLGVRIRVNE